MDKKIKTLKKRIDKIAKSLQIDKLESRLGKLQTKSMEEDFWNNRQQATQIMQEISEIENQIKRVNEIKKSLNEIKEFWNLMKQEDAEDKEEIQKDLDKIEDNISKFETQQFLSGKYDKNDAILSIHSGQGGTEANDWTEMLLRMYLRYCENQGWQTSILHQVQGDEAGLGTVTIEVKGEYAFGYLKNERGTHRLIRLSPFNAQNLRQTSFAGVEVLPVLEDVDVEDIEIPESDIDFKAVRAGGPGGQYTNKTSTAVTLTHTPTDITVNCSSQRSQHQNRKKAMQMLKAKLWEKKQAKEEEIKDDLKGEHKIAAWGNQIRNYILHPYKLVKDLRTDIEVTDPEAVLDGELDKFIDAEIRLKKSEV
jgi:peptide chain release factor 2